jgi:hypothetical protein
MRMDEETETTVVRFPLLDRFAARVGIWALRRLYGADCETDVNADFPGEGMYCISCDAKRIILSLADIANG